ncbi:MAG: hypothetical protein ABIL70_04340 [candidate division WOR-3 bacterium]
MSVFLFFLLNNMPPQSFTITVTGNHYYSESYLTGGNRRFKNLKQVERLIKRILEYYNNAGFAFCRIEPEVIYEDSTGGQVVLRVEEGERVIISDYIFRIKGKTDISQLRRFLRLKLSDYFSLKELNRVKEKIKRSELFKDEKEEIIKKNGQYYIFFDLLEDKTDFIAGAGSLAQNRANFAISLFSINFFGTLRQLRFDFESNLAPEEKDIPRRHFQVGFTEPVIIAPVTFKTNLILDTRDTSRLSFIEARLVSPVTDYLSLSLFSGIEMISYPSQINPEDFTNTLLGLGLEFNYNFQGLSTNQKLDFDYLIRANERYRFKYDGEFTFFSISLRPHCWWVKTEAFDDFDFYRLGGAQTLRGYWEEEFIVREFVLFNIEYKRYPIYPIFDLAFTDDTLLYSYGLGIDASTNLGAASLIFAWPRNAKFGDGKVHFLLKKGF